MSWDSLFGKKPPIKATEVGPSAGGQEQAGREKTPIPGLSQESRQMINEILFKLQEPKMTVANLKPAEIVLLANTSELTLSRAAALSVGEKDPLRMERVGKLGELVKKARADALSVIEARRATARDGKTEQSAAFNANEPSIVPAEETAGLIETYEEFQRKNAVEGSDDGWEAVNETISLPTGTPVRVRIGETTIETRVKDHLGEQYVVEVGGMDVALPAAYLEAKPITKAEQSSLSAVAPGIDEFFVEDIAAMHESPRALRGEHAPAIVAEEKAKPFRMGEFVSAKTQDGRSIRGVFYGLGFESDAQTAPQAIRAVILLEGGMSTETVDVGDVQHIEDNISGHIKEHTGFSPADTVTMKSDPDGVRYRVVGTSVDAQGKRSAEILPESILNGAAARTYVAKIKKASEQIHTPAGRGALEENQKWLDELFVTYKKVVPLDDIEQKV